MGEESTLPVKGTAVTMETLAEEDHDVCKLLHFVPNVAVRDFPEPERSDALPHLEGLPDGLISLILAYLGGVILYTEEVKQDVWVEGKKELIITSYAS